MLGGYSQLTFTGYYPSGCIYFVCISTYQAHRKASLSYLCSLSNSLQFVQRFYLLIIPRLSLACFCPPHHLLLFLQYLGLGPQRLGLSWLESLDFSVSQSRLQLEVS